MDPESPVAWSNWANGFFVDEPTGEQCARMWIDKEGEWGSKDCTSEIKFICESGKKLVKNLPIPATRFFFKTS